MNTISPRLAFAGLCLAVSAGFPVLLASSADKAAKAPPDLSGTWKINEDLTQRMQQESGQDKPQGGWNGGGRGGGRGGGMGRRGGGGGYPRGGGGGGTGGSGAGSGEAAGGAAGTPAEGEGALGADGALTMTWAAPALTVTYPGGRTRVVYTDNRKVKEDRPGGKPMKTQAHWTDSGSLEVVSKMDDGTTRTEIYELSNDGHRLFVIVGIEGRGPKPLQFRRVYDKLEAPDKDEEEQEDPQLA